MASRLECLPAEIFNKILENLVGTDDPEHLSRHEGGLLPALPYARCHYILHPAILRANKNIYQLAKSYLDGNSWVIFQINDAEDFHKWMCQWMPAFVIHEEDERKIPSGIMYVQVQFPFEDEAYSSTVRPATKLFLIHIRDLKDFLQWLRTFELHCTARVHEGQRLTLLDQNGHATTEHRAEKGKHGLQTFVFVQSTRLNTSSQLELFGMLHGPLNYIFIVGSQDASLARSIEASVNELPKEFKGNPDCEVILHLIRLKNMADKYFKSTETPNALRLGHALYNCAESLNAGWKANNFTTPEEMHMHNPASNTYALAALINAGIKLNGFAAALRGEIHTHNKPPEDLHYADELLMVTGLHPRSMAEIYLIVGLHSCFCVQGNSMEGRVANINYGLDWLHGAYRCFNNCTRNVQESCPGPFQLCKEFEDRVQPRVDRFMASRVENEGSVKDTEDVLKDIDELEHLAKPYWRPLKLELYVDDLPATLNGSGMLELLQEGNSPRHFEQDVYRVLPTSPLSTETGKSYLL